MTNGITVYKFINLKLHVRNKSENYYMVYSKYLSF